MRVDPTLLVGTPPRELRLDGFSLTVVEGPDVGRSFRPQSSEVSVGSAPGNDLVLNDPTVSRHHFSLLATTTGLLLQDLGSSNGTMVGDVRIERGYLQSGAWLRVGRTTLRINHEAEDICETLSQEDRFGPLLGASSGMRRIFAALPRIAQSESTVLLQGETGTGKGVLASAIHDGSARASGPFVVLDCTAIAPTLIESELFGHVKGAFSGALSNRAGAFEQAKGGTIFIDEIGELPLEMQPKLLRALEERTVKPVGGNERVRLDARVIAATNRDLRREVNNGTFRADLFYRLNIVRIRIPPLRERTGDVERLARHFYADFVPDRPMPIELLERLRRQPWPGNVRELKAAVERALLFEDSLSADLGSPELGSADLGLPLSERAPEGAPSGPAPSAPASGLFDPRLSFREAKQQASDEWERAYLQEVWTKAKGNVSEASRLVRMDRSHLRALLRKYGIGGDDALAG